MRRAVTATLLAVLFSAAATGLAYRHDLRAANDQLLTTASIAPTTHGPVAFETGGNGPAVLVIHGAGGGHDQGRLLAGAFLPSGYRWIAPSRFGYPGSSLPDDASTAAQADAFAEMLDSLGIRRVTVLAMSGGVPPALQFALRYPDRTQALLLLALAPYAPLTAEEQELPLPIWLYDTFFASDFPFWVVLHVSPRSLAPIFDARAELIPQMTAAEARFLDAMIAAFLPVTKRRTGLANEGAAIDSDGVVDVAAIRVPVLIVHARDDRIAPFSTAVFTAEHVPQAEVLTLETGGHLLLGHHDEVRQRIADFLEDAGGRPNK